MGLFDFFKSEKEKTTIDLTDCKVISNDHIRYQDGKDVSGHNYDCWRGIRIQTNISGGQGYTVTIYNLDGNHPVWGDNIQMAPKQMKVTEQTANQIKLRGYGLDQMGNSFADYGLILSISKNDIDKVTLQMFDRNIEIVYSKISNSVDSNKKIATNKTYSYTDILELSARICNAKGILELNSIYSQIGDFEHPQILYDLGVHFFILGDKNKAKQILLKGAEFGLFYNAEFYNTPFSDAVGQCLALVLIEYNVSDFTMYSKALALSYAYLSKSIDVFLQRNSVAFDSYKTRGRLLAKNKNQSEFDGKYDFIKKNMTFNRSINSSNENAISIVVPFIIADYYNAALPNISPFKEYMNDAQQIHRNLGDMPIDDIPANEYELSEIVKTGNDRHSNLFTSINTKLRNGELDMTKAQLYKVFA